MPYVSSEEAPNKPVANLTEMSLEWRSASRRMPIVGSDTCRVVLWQLAPGQDPHPPHRHSQSDEVMIVLSGHGEFQVGDTPEFLAGPMSVVFAPRGVPHTVHVPGPEPLLWLTVVAPNVKDADEEVVAVASPR